MDYYAGIDVSLEASSVCVVDASGKIVKGGGMSCPASPTMAPCSRPSTPLRAAYRGGLRPVLTATARAALLELGRDGETAFSRTEKLSPARRGAKGEVFSSFRAG